MLILPEPHHSQQCGIFPAKPSLHRTGLILCNARVERKASLRGHKVWGEKKGKGKEKRKKENVDGERMGLKGGGKLSAHSLQGRFDQSARARWIPG